MSSLIWLDEPETSVLGNTELTSALWNTELTDMSKVFIRTDRVFDDRHIIGKGNILEGRIGQ